MLPKIDMPAPIPNLDDLEVGLGKVFNRKGARRGRLTVLHREPTPYLTTFPCEIVTCRFQDGSELRLFCKYTNGNVYTAHGHRGGVNLEIAVYEDVLRPLDFFRPKFFGTYIDSKTGHQWLILEYLNDSLRVGKIKDASAMAQAARWIAKFHLANEDRVTGKRLRFLKRYDEEYYLGWVRRTFEYSASLHKYLPWLRVLCECSKEWLVLLLISTPTIIHGEYYPHNILYKRGSIFPVDWESAAIAEGLIDLATLTDGWRKDVVRRCEAEYKQARWPGSPSPGFAQTLAAARLYLQFRWLGERVDWTTDEDNRWRFDELQSAGSELRLI